MTPIKAELIYGGTHDGTGEPHPNGSYAKITLVEHGDPKDDPQVLSFLVPHHQLPKQPT